MQDLLKLAEALEQQTKPLAIIITGNPKYIKGIHRNMAKSFYTNLKQELIKNGYRVEFDPGEPYTEPPTASLWVGHSRGADRLRFANQNIVKVLGFGIPKSNKNYLVVNHPKDPANLTEEVDLNSPLWKYHYTLTPAMKAAIRKVSTH